MSNPLLAAFAPEGSPGGLPMGLLEQGAFLLITLLLSWVLVARASRSLRPTVLSQANRPQKREKPGAPARLLDYLPGPPLDGNPVLWREWHRKKPSRWTGRFWTAYAVASTLASLYVIGWYYAWWGTGMIDSGIHILAAQVNAWQVAVGLLLLSVSAATSLAEERDRGSLDVIMATTLTSREIVLGKWWGTFAMVPRLAIMPIWVAAGASMITGSGLGLVLMIGMILAYRGGDHQHRPGGGDLDPPAGSRHHGERDGVYAGRRRLASHLANAAGPPGLPDEPLGSHRRTSTASPWRARSSAYTRRPSGRADGHMAAITTSTGDTAHPWPTMTRPGR